MPTSMGAMLISTELQEQLAKATGQLPSDSSSSLTKEGTKDTEDQDPKLTVAPTLATVWSIFKNIYLNLHPDQDSLEEENIAEHTLQDIDRLGIVELSIRLEQKFHIPLDYKEIEKLTFLSDISDYIDHRLNEKLND